MARKRTDLSAIKAQFPSIDDLDWSKLFHQDIELYARVWRDILKFDQAGQGRPGPRPALDPHAGWKRFMQLTEDDYSMLPFPEAMRLISNNATIREIVTATGIGRNTIHRLMSGKMEPDAFELEACALAYGRRPAYFLEYRISFILRMVYAHMRKFPESSVGPYKKVRDALNKDD